MRSNKNNSNALEIVSTKKLEGLSSCKDIYDKICTINIHTRSGKCK